MAKTLRVDPGAAIKAPFTPKCRASSKIVGSPLFFKIELSIVICD
ncbi:hypothetical protein EVA_08719 [gut metagenome]|uniref:Uncharacterized protein n=1 Tax=gut metagenome TaxID=749906 RepID=J9CSK0_9ZZZZ